MSEHSGDLVSRIAADAVIEQYKAGGIIDSVISGPELSMQEVVQGHLDAVALSNSRGSTTTEQSTYMFDPSRGLLINYSFRRYSDPELSGLFAEIVELDEQGKPQYGISSADPFKNGKGFFNVAVKENRYGFAPSFVDIKLVGEDQAPPAPPNIEIADLVTMLGDQGIAEWQTLEEFVRKKFSERENLRDRVAKAFYTRFMGSEQALAPRTDANYHLIVTDREDASALAAASRSVGIFPIVLSAMEVAERAKNLEELDPRKHPELDNGEPELSAKLYDDSLNQLITFVPYSAKHNATRRLFREITPAFVTLDFEDDRHETDEQRQRKLVTSKAGGRLEAWKVVDHVLGGSLSGSHGPLKTEPVFSRVTNYRRGVDPSYFSDTEKMCHGVYEMTIDPDNTEPYKAWLRKNRLDFMLTLYLRGINNL